MSDIKLFHVTSSSVQELSGTSIAIEKTLQTVIETYPEVFLGVRFLKNFACVEVHPQSKRVLIFVKTDPASIKLEKGFTRDVRAVGHYGTGDLEITVQTDDDLERAKSFIIKSYEVS